MWSRTIMWYNRLDACYCSVNTPPVPTGSILFLSVISLHRFIGICYPVRSLSWLSIRRAKLVSVGVWACVLSGQAPVLYYSSTR